MNNTPAPELPGDRPTLFESEVCGRCGGGGQYSFNYMHGSVCYGCGGRGRKMTKRGAAAQQFYRDLLSKPVGEFKPGELIHISPSPAFGGGGLCEVESVILLEGGRVELKTAPAPRGGYPVTLCGEPADTRYRFGATPEQKAAAREQALAYQANLTKQGKPRKRPVAA